MQPLIRIYTTSLTVDMLESLYSARMSAVLRCYQHLVPYIEEEDLAIYTSQRKEGAHENGGIREELHQKGHLKKINGRLVLPQAVLIWKTKNKEKMRWLGNYERCQYLIDSKQLELIILQKLSTSLVYLTLPRAIIPFKAAAMNLETCTDIMSRVVLIADLHSTLTLQQYNLMTEVLSLFKGSIAVLDSENVGNEKQGQLLSEAEAYLVKKGQDLREWKKLTLWVRGKAIGMERVEKLIKTGLLSKIKEKLAN